MHKSTRLFLFLFVFLASGASLHAQILNAERFGKDLDSNDVFTGMVDASYSGARRVTVISSFKLGLDFSVKWKHNELITTGSYSWLLSGRDQIRNEGFLHSRYRYEKPNSAIVPESFFQVQRDAILGMNRRLLAGQNLRIRIAEDSLGLLYAGIGAFYETELWDYSGVPDADLIPADPVPIETQFIKANLYISARRQITDNFSAGAVVYVQARPDAFIIYPRIASDISINLAISEVIGFKLGFSSVYDRRPIVPIYNFYFNTSTGIQVNF